MGLDRHTRTTAAVRSVLLAVLAAALAAGLTSCSLVAKIDEVTKAVREAGVEVSGVNIDNTNGYTTLYVEYVSHEQTTEGSRAEMNRVAEAVWRKAPVGFDQLSLAALGEGGETLSRDFSRAELRERFGPRPPDLKTDTLGGLRRDLLIFGSVALGVLTLVIAVVVVLVRRSRRRHPPVAPGWPWPGSAGQPWPSGARPGQPAPWAQPATWTQPAPPQQPRPSQGQSQQPGPWTQPAPSQQPGQRSPDPWKPPDSP